MKRIKLYLLFVVLGVSYAYTSSAQERLKLKIGYNIGMPLGSFKDFMPKNSFRGFHGDIMYTINDKFNVGLGIASQDFYEKIPRQLYETKDGTISAVKSNSVLVTPIMLKGNYNLMRESLISPYVGIGAGFNLVRFGEYLGEFGDVKTSFKPAATADVGVNVPFNKETRAAGINLGVNFNYLPYKANGLTNLNTWGVHLGAYFPLR